jgi:hypothetical protein
MTCPDATCPCRRPRIDTDGRQTVFSAPDVSYEYVEIGEGIKPDHVRVFAIVYQESA